MNLANDLINPGQALVLKYFELHVDHDDSQHMCGEFVVMAMRLYLILIIFQIMMILVTFMG